jgi:hypothetical protein
VHPTDCGWISTLVTYPRIAVSKQTGDEMLRKAGWELHARAPQAERDGD